MAKADAFSPEQRSISMTLSLQSLALALTLSTAGLGCGGSSGSATNDPVSSTPATSDSVNGSTASDPGSAPTFTNVYGEIIGLDCTSCHIPGGEGSFLDMSTQATAYMNLVGVKADGPSCGRSGLVRVVAGDATASLLYEKVSESTPPCGSQMPLGCSGSVCLSFADQREIADWINGGALDN
jgi:hypothetical protein